MFHFVTAVSCVAENEAGSCKIDNVRVYVGKCKIKADEIGPVSDSIPVSQLCNDNHATSLCAVHNFIKELDHLIDSYFSLEKRDLYLHCSDDPDELKTACFLLGTYMILVQNHEASSLHQKFAALFNPDDIIFEDFRRNDCDLVVLDRWMALKRAFDRGLIPLLESGNFSSDGNKLNVRVVTSKLVIIQAIRNVQPNAIAALIRSRSIVAIVRLLAANPDPAGPPPPHLCPGVRQMHLSFDGGATPPPSAISFLFRRVVDCADGEVAPRAARRRSRRCT